MSNVLYVKKELKHLKATHICLLLACVQIFPDCPTFPNRKQWTEILPNLFCGCYYYTYDYANLVLCLNGACLTLQIWFEHRLALWRKQQGLPANAGAVNDWWSLPHNDIYEAVNLRQLHSWLSHVIPWCFRTESSSPRGSSVLPRRNLHWISLLILLQFNLILSTFLYWCGSVLLCCLQRKRTNNPVILTWRFLWHRTL